MQMQKIKDKAKEFNLTYLSNIPWVKGQYTIEDFADGRNYTQIFLGNSWKEVLKGVEVVLKSDHGLLSGALSSGKPRRMRGLGKIENFKDYEIRVLRINEDMLHSGKELKIIELTVGKREV